MGEDSAPPAIENTALEERGPAETLPSEVFTTGALFFGILSLWHGKKSWLSAGRGDIIRGPRNPWPAPDSASLFSLVNRPFPSASNCPLPSENGSSPGGFWASGLGRALNHTVESTNDAPVPGGIPRADIRLNVCLFMFVGI